MKNIITSIDGNIVETTESIYNDMWKIIDKELAESKMHFDNSPFGAIIYLCDADALAAVKMSNDDKYYWTKKIIEGKKINPKFDILNYAKRSFEKQKYNPSTVKITTAKERLAEKRSFDSFWGTFL